MTNRPGARHPIAATAIVDAPRLLPDETWSVSVPVDGVVPIGLLSATVTLVPLYTDPAGSTGPLTAVERSGQGWAIPWLPLVLILCLGALVSVVSARTLRHSSAPPETVPQDSTMAAHAD